MKIDSHIVRKCLIGFAVGILMNGTGIVATDPTNIDPKLNSLTPNPTHPDKVLLARGSGGGGGRSGGGRGGGSRGGSYHGGRSSRGASGYRSSPRSSSRMSSGRSGGSRSRISSPRSKSPSSRTSSIKASSRRSSGTAGAKKSFSTTSTRSKTARSKVASTRGTSSRSFATRSGGRGGGGGRHHSGGHGHHGHHNHNRYWGYGHWYGGWGGWYYPWWGWCFGFGLGLGYGWYGPWWGFWDFPSYWAWYWPGFALSVFYAGLYAPQPYVIVLGEDRANYYAVYTRSQDDDGNVVYIKTDRYGIVNPNEKTKIEITDRSNNVIIIARNKKKLGDKLSSDAVSSKDNYSVVDPSEAPDKLEEGENPEVTDEQIQGFQKQVKDKKNAELLKEKAEAADTIDTSDAKKEADKWEKESTEWEQLQTTEIAD